MKKTIPLILGCAVGIAAFVLFYIPAKEAGDVRGVLFSYAQILMATAFILGAINVVQVNWPKIRRREKDWGFKVVLLASATIMAVVGIKWHLLSKEHKDGVVAVAWGTVTSKGKAVIRVETTGDHVMVAVDGLVVEPESPGVAMTEVAPGKHKIRVAKGVPGKEIKGYSIFEKEVELRAGQAALAKVNPLQLQWGENGRVFEWLYEYVFFPCNATVFALLAFFIASAAFRAFRARNSEAALLLGAAIFVMLGRVPIGRLISDAFPEIADWLIEIPNNAGRRAIMMGAAIGAIATGLRVILGIERSHLGED